MARIYSLLFIDVLRQLAWSSNGQSSESTTQNASWAVSPSNDVLMNASNVTGEMFTIDGEQTRNENVAGLNFLSRQNVDNLGGSAASRLPTFGLKVYLTPHSLDLPFCLDHTDTRLYVKPCSLKHGDVHYHPRIPREEWVFESPVEYPTPNPTWKQFHLRTSSTTNRCATFNDGIGAWLWGDGVWTKPCKHHDRQQIWVMPTEVRKEGIYVGTTEPKGIQIRTFVGTQRGPEKCLVANKDKVPGVLHMPEHLQKVPVELKDCDPSSTPQTWYVLPWER